MERIRRDIVAGKVGVSGEWDDLTAERTYRIFCLVMSFTVRLTYTVMSIDFTASSQKRVRVICASFTYVRHLELLSTSRAAQTL